MSLKACFLVVLGAIFFHQQQQYWVCVNLKWVLCTWIISSESYIYIYIECPLLCIAWCFILLHDHAKETEPHMIMSIIFAYFHWTTHPDGDQADMQKAEGIIKLYSLWSIRQHKWLLVISRLWTHLWARTILMMLAYMRTKGLVLSQNTWQAQLMKMIKADPRTNQFSTNSFWHCWFPRTLKNLSSKLGIQGPFKHHPFKANRFILET